MEENKVIQEKTIEKFSEMLVEDNKVIQEKKWKSAWENWKKDFDETGSS